ncbi:unnamed protein product, partial [Allacma fusca]
TLESTVNTVNNGGKIASWTMKNNHALYYFNANEKNVKIRRKSKPFAKHGSKFVDPFVQSNPINLLETIFNFAISDLDFNASSKAYRTDVEFSIIPTLDITDPYRRNIKYVFQLSQTSPFNFITSDSVTALNLDLALYSHPFDKSTWISLGLSALTLGLIFSSRIISSHRHNSLFRITSSTIDAFAVLVEQSGPDFEEQQT